MNVNEFEELLALRGTIAIEYDWGQEEAPELITVDDDLTIFQVSERTGSGVASPNFK